MPPDTTHDCTWPLKHILPASCTACLGSFCIMPCLRVPKGPLLPPLLWHRIAHRAIQLWCRLKLHAAQDAVVAAELQLKLHALNHRMLNAAVERLYQENRLHAMQQDVSEAGSFRHCKYALKFPWPDCHTQPQRRSYAGLCTEAGSRCTLKEHWVEHSGHLEEYKSHLNVFQCVSWPSCVMNQVSDRLLIKERAPCKSISNGCNQSEHWSSRQRRCSSAKCRSTSACLCRKGWLLQDMLAT